MQLADRAVINATPPVNRASPMFSEPNQSVYLNLKLSLSLNLRRQLFLAVCDDLALRNRLAAQLYAELAYPPQSSTPSSCSSKPTSGHLDRYSSVAKDGIRTDTLAIKQTLPLAYPRLVSLNLNLHHPHPMVQVKQWLEQYPPPRGIYQQSQCPGFQILGIERLTRQSATAQREFLNSLQQIEQYLCSLESALLLWVPRPWLRAIQQSAPTFWNWYTALFEFEGDPTPVPNTTFSNSSTNRSVAQSTATAPKPTQQRVSEQRNDRRPATASKPNRLANQSQAKSSETSSSHPAQGRPKTSKSESSVPPRDVVEAKADLLQPNKDASPEEDLWDILTHDLALLKGPQESVPPVSNAPATSAPTSTLSPGSASAPSPLPAGKTPLPYEPHSVQDLANFVLAIALDENDSTSAGEHSELIQALESIEQLHYQNAAHEALATAYQNLGNLYRDRIEQGDDSEQSLMIAICAYEQVLNWLDESSSLWSDVLNDIGNLYWMISRNTLDSNQALFLLERAITAYQFGLSKTHPETRPQNYAMIQNNLGSAYGDLARYRTPREALEQSVRAYEKALSYRTFKEDPARYAATQNNLGTAYWNLAQHYQPVSCLKQAIAAYNEALRYYSPEREPIYYAMIQNNLGTAFWNLAQHKQSAPDEDGTDGKVSSPSDLLQQAIAAYCNALTFRTMESVPTAYAATQNNLGTAHWHLANLSGVQLKDRQEHLRQAIEAYESAILAVNHITANTEQPPPLTFDPAATHNNLGLAYYQIAIDKHNQESAANRSKYLESALSHHLQALQGWQQNPEFYQSAFGYVLQTVRTFYNELGTRGQNLALSKLPVSLLPNVMKQL